MTSEAITTIGSLIYGVGKEKDKFYVFSKRESNQWIKQYGPFKYFHSAKGTIRAIEREYNANRAEENKSHL